MPVLCRFGRPWSGRAKINCRLKRGSQAGVADPQKLPSQDYAPAWTILVRDGIAEFETRPGKECKCLGRAVLPELIQLSRNDKDLGAVCGLQRDGKTQYCQQPLPDGACQPFQSGLFVHHGESLKLREDAG